MYGVFGDTLHIKNTRLNNNVINVYEGSLINVFGIKNMTIVNCSMEDNLLIRFALVYFHTVDNVLV